MIKYKKMSLFDSPEGSILAHACNAKGVWGRGIAKEFKDKFPNSFKEYNEFCKNQNTIGKSLLGSTENGYQVLSIVTSSDYGNHTDEYSEILANTTLALQDFMVRLAHMDAIYLGPIYSNKFNSGLFGVPWEWTEEILKVFIKKYNLNWTVCYQE
jgi:ADP-ribose 1''-phosphate phosphatase